MAKRETAYVFDSGRHSKLPPVSQEFFETIFESSYDGIYITDSAAVTLMVNKSYEFISGLRREDMLGQDMHELVEKHVISRSGTLAALETRRPVTMEQSFKTGKRATITSTPIFNEDNQIVLVVTNVRDVTELYELQRQLEMSQEQSRQYFSELESLRHQMPRSAKVIAEDPAMREVLQVARKVAELDVPILLEGEIGVGKQELARYIAARSRRKKARFIEVDCSSYTEGMLERELFGSASPDTQDQGTMGLLELADGGTLLLGEAGEIPAEVQARLTRFLQTRRFERVGSMAPIQVDVRILASTSRDLKKLVDERQFREDLYYALNVLPIQVPPLRQRRDDILPIADRLCTDLNKKYHKRKRFTQSARLALWNYNWPGNIRELHNVVESAVILSDEDLIHAEDLALPQSMHSPARQPSDFTESLDLRKTVEALELRYIRAAYQKYGNVRDAARSLGMDPSTFVRKRARLEEREKQ